MRSAIHEGRGATSPDVVPTPGSRRPRRLTRADHTQKRSTALRITQRLAMGVAAATLLAGCGDPARLVAPADVLDAGAPLATVAALPVDVSGSWSWQEELVSVMPQEIAILIGLQPEGTVTHVTCTDYGTITLVQSGSTFAGTATQTSVCQTRGGQQFSPFPPEVDITNGRINGQSLHFDFGGCPYDAVATPAGGEALRLEGTGMCPVDLRPALLKTVTFEAVRI
jgi:hypothetical protein